MGDFFFSFSFGYFAMELEIISVLQVEILKIPHYLSYPYMSVFPWYLMTMWAINK